MGSSTQNQLPALVCREVFYNEQGETMSKLKEVDDEWILRRLKRWGRRDNMPFLGPEKAAVVQDIIRRKQPKCVVEVGGMCGYSALKMSQVLPPGAHHALRMSQVLPPGAASVTCRVRSSSLHACQCGSCLHACHRSHCNNGLKGRKHQWANHEACIGCCTLVYRCTSLSCMPRKQCGRCVRLDSEHVCQ
jgi:hypothetical protein